MIAARHAAIALAVVAAVALLAYDPDALAVAPKRTGLWLLAIGCSAIVLASRERPPLSRAVLAWCGFATWSAISLVWGARIGTLDAALWLAPISILFALRQMPLPAAQSSARWVALLSVAGTAMFALVGESHAGHGNPDWAAIGVAVALPLLFDLRDTPSGRMRLTHVAVIFLGIGALLVCRSRAAWLAALAGVWIMLLRYRRRPRLVIVSAVAIVFVVLSANRAALTALDGRGWIWARTLGAIRDTTPIGIGLGNFATAFLSQQTEALAARASLHLFVEPTTAHNDWLQVTLEGGVPATLCFGLTLLFALRACWRAEWLGGLGTVVAFAVAAIGDTPLRQPLALVAFLFVVAAAPADAPPRRLPRVAPWLLLGIGSVALTLSLADWMGARIATRARRADPLERLESLTVAARLAPCSFDVAFERALAAHELRETTGPAIELLVAAHALRPTVGGEVAIGNSYFVAEQLALAKLHYERALALDPGSFRAAVNLGLTEVRLHHLEPARAALRRARAIYRYHPAADALAEAIDAHP